MAFALTVALPLATFAQGRSRGDNGNWRWGNKCDKFVNCHDASDGRVDKHGDRNRDDRNRDDRNYNQDRDRDRNDNRDNRQEQRGRNWDRYGNYGGSYQLRQTALNAGYNEGIKEGRRDRNRRSGSDYRNNSAYRNADKDYSSRLGDKELYRRYYREGYENGYRDGYNGY
jgi:hypothetical protein